MGSRVGKGRRKRKEAQERPPDKAQSSDQRQKGRDDPALLGAQHPPGAGGGAAVHHLDPDALRFQRTDEGTGRLAQARAGADQQKFRPRINVEQIAQIRRRQRVDRRGALPRQRSNGREQQAIGKDIIPDSKAPALKAGDDRPLPRLIAAQLDAGPRLSGCLAVQGRAPSSRGPMRSACAAILAFAAFFSALAGDRPSVISSEEDT